MGFCCKRFQKVIELEYLREPFRADDGRWKDLIKLDKGAFPAEFTWGAATASYQIEGAVHEGGRGASIWDTFSHTPGKVFHDETGDIACDHYHRVSEDVQLMDELGISSYRFSIAWPRIQPEGKGPLNKEGLKFYLDLVARLRSCGIDPLPTLYHWDLPQALGDRGGWTSRETAYRFADYVRMLVEAIGPEVSRWITFNEPWCSSWLGYGLGQHAPGVVGLGSALSANHHLLLAHGLAVAEIRRTTKAAVGITLNLAHVTPASEHPLDVQAAQLVEGNANRMFLDPIFKAAYPSDMMQRYENDMTVVELGDLATIAAPIDFLGVNYYHPLVVGSRDRISELRALGYIVDTSKPANVIDSSCNSLGLGRPGAKKTLMNWEIEPARLTDLLLSVRAGYGDIPIYITENGLSSADYVRHDGTVADPERIDYVTDHIAALAAALEAGVNVKGYYVWSLFDNFEWALGYSQRFGLVFVDYATMKRIPKASYYWYRDFIANRKRATLADTVDSSAVAPHAV